jgi:hypothetical protein
MAHAPVAVCVFGSRLANAWRKSAARQGSWAATLAHTHAMRKGEALNFKIVDAVAEVRPYV